MWLNSEVCKPAIQRVYPSCTIDNSGSCSNNMSRSLVQRDCRLYILSYYGIKGSLTCTIGHLTLDRYMGKKAGIVILVFLEQTKAPTQHFIGYYTGLQSRGQIFQINIVNIYNRIPYEWKRFIITSYYYYHHP